MSHESFRWGLPFLVEGKQHNRESTWKHVHLEVESLEGLKKLKLERVYIFVAFGVDESAMLNMLVNRWSHGRVYKITQRPRGWQSMWLIGITCGKEYNCLGGIILVTIKYMTHKLSYCAYFVVPFTYFWEVGVSHIHVTYAYYKLTSNLLQECYALWISSTCGHSSWLFDRGQTNGSIQKPSQKESLLFNAMRFSLK